MRRWIPFVAVLSSIFIVAFVGGLVATHREEPHVATPSEEAAFERAYCDALNQGVPLPSLSTIHLAGGFTLGSIDCGGA